MLRRTLAALCILSVLAACTKESDKNAAGAATGNQRPLLLAPEDIHTLRPNSLAFGPLITGSVQPERRADLRAELSALVVQVLTENGASVRRGDLLVRIDDTALRENLASAEASTRAARQSFEQAERQFQRLTTLRKSGMASTQQLEDTEVRRNSAQIEVEAATTRLVQARQQLQPTEVRAPFDGIVSDRRVSAGDTAQIGKELVKVIDPSSMRFEGLLSADSIGDVRTGQTVVFRVNGYGDQDFTGKVKRINPVANPTTRQVEILVDILGQMQPKLAGLYAEGRIETGGAASLTIPPTALVRDGDKTAAWRLDNKTLRKVSIVIGDRDSRSGDFVLLSGLADGDRLIRYPSATLKDGQMVEMATTSAIPSAAQSK